MGFYDNKDPDMVAELYLGPFAEIPELAPLMSEAKCLENLKSGRRRGEKITACFNLALISRLQRRGGGGKFSREGALRLLCQLETQIGTDFEEEAGEYVLCEGTFCENTGDFDGAFCMYEGALRFNISDHKSAYFRFNNLGFCLNYLKRFEEAKDYLQKAIEHEPRAYNAWKNAGVAYEWSGRPDLAANGYIQAINKSGGEARSLKHFLRLLERNSELLKDGGISGYLKSLKLHGKI